MIIYYLFIFDLFFGCLGVVNMTGTFKIIRKVTPEHCFTIIIVPDLYIIRIVSFLRFS